MLEKAEPTLINMLSKTKKVITTPPPVLCSVASYKLLYSTTWSAGTLSLLFVPPAEGDGMEINMKNELCLNAHNNLANTNTNINIDLKNVQKVTTKTKVWSANINFENGIRIDYMGTTQEIYNGGDK